MADNLNPPQSPNNEGNQNAPDKHSCHKSGSDPIKKITTPDGNDGVKPNSIWILLGGLDAGGVLLFWGYSEFFGSHNSPILSNICFFGFTASVLAAIAGFAFKHWPHAVFICFIYICSCGFSGLVIYEYAKPLPPIATEPKPIKSNEVGWLPPELPTDCSNIVIFFGNVIESIPKSEAEFLGKTYFHEIVPFKEVPKDMADSATKILPKDWLDNPNLAVGGTEFTMTYVTGENVECPINPYVISNRLFVSVKIPFHNAQQEISMSDAMDSKLPPYWDWNWSSNAFEVINERNKPVLQVWYDHPNQIDVRGVFVLNTNFVVATFGRRIPFEITHGKPTVISQYSRFDPPFQEIVTETQTFDSIEDFNKKYPNKAVGAWVNEKEIYSMVFSGQEPIFKYPSFQHRGVFADETPTNAPWENERLVFPTNSSWEITNSWRQ